VEVRDQLRSGKHRVMAEPARDGTRMAGAANAFDGAVTDIAANSRDDADRQLSRKENRALFDMQLEPGSKVFALNERLCRCDPIEVGAHLAHALAERSIGVGCLHFEISRRELPKQRVRSHTRLAKARAFLAAQRKKLACA